MTSIRCVAKRCLISAAPGQEWPSTWENPPPSKTFSFLRILCLFMQLHWSLCDSIQLLVCVALWEDPQLGPSVISQQWKGGHWKRSIFRPFPSFSFSYCASIELSDIAVHIDKPSWKSRNCSGNNVGRLLLVLVLGLACRHLLLAGKLPSRCHTCKVFPFACFRLETTLCATVCGLSN